MTNPNPNVGSINYQNTSLFFQSFDPSFRDRVHQLIKMGHTLARGKINSQTEETHITTHISEAIEDIFEDPFSEIDWSYYDIDEDSLIRKLNTYGKSKPRIDIIIKFCSKGPRPKYLFEAKRVRTPTYPASIYVGNDGLQCFTSGLYGSAFPETAMLGYIQSHTVIYWRKKIIDEIDNSAAIIELLPPQYDYNGPYAIQYEWVSEHERKKLDVP